MAATALVSGSRGMGTLTFWDAAGKVQQIVYYPAITAASVNSDWPGSVYSIARDTGPIAVVCTDTGRVHFINASTLNRISTYQYDTSDPITGNTQFPYQAFGVGTETWVFSSGFDAAVSGTYRVYLDKFDASGNLTSTTDLGAGRLTHVASWDKNTFYLLIGSAFIWKWTVGDPAITFIRDISADIAAGETNPFNLRSTQICMHGAGTLVVSTADPNVTSHSNIALFDVSGGGCAFIKHYLVNSFPQFAALPENSTNLYTFAVASNGSLIYTSTQNGPTMWTIDPATDAVAIFNQDVQVFQLGTGPPARAAASIPNDFPTTPANAATFSGSEHPDGVTGISVLDFAGRTFPLAHFDGLADSADLRFWPIVDPPLARLPDESYVAEVRSEVTLRTPLHIPRKFA